MEDAKTPNNPQLEKLAETVESAELSPVAADPQLSNLVQSAESTEVPQEPIQPVNNSPPEPEADSNDKQVVHAFELMNHLNEDANNLTRGGNYKLAIEKYKQALQTANLELFANMPDLRADYRDLRTRIISNVALCWLKLEDWAMAKVTCELGLKSVPDHAKMRFRLAQALYNLKDYEESLTQINKALQAEPNNQNIRAQREDIIKAKRAYNQSSLAGLKGRLAAPSKDMVVVDMEQEKDGEQKNVEVTKVKEGRGSTGLLLGAAAVGAVVGGFFLAKKYYSR